MRLLQLPSNIKALQLGSDPDTCRRTRRRLRIVCLASVIAALACVAQPVHAAMRCGSRLVSHGDHKIEVLSKCGQPAFVESRGYGYYTHRPDHAHGSRTHYTVHADIEDWTYNFGPRRFMRLVRFADGKVVRIISLDYGY
ncbi:MAG: DUF2845 domain-containing protein [Gammaproteobacteria bacterium]|nr:DUF2845 domain-containing protein [Gammaproteobacteria bacterium]